MHPTTPNNTTSYITYNMEYSAYWDVIMYYHINLCFSNIMMWHIFIEGCKPFGLHQVWIKFNLFIKISNFYIFLIVSLFFIHNNYHPISFFFLGIRKKNTKCKIKIVSVNLQDYGSNHIFLHKSMWPDISKFWIFFFFFFFEER